MLQGNSEVCAYNKLLVIYLNAYKGEIDGPKNMKDSAFAIHDLATLILS